MNFRLLRNQQFEDNELQSVLFQELGRSRPTTKNRRIAPGAIRRARQPADSRQSRAASWRASGARGASERGREAHEKVRVRGAARPEERRRAGQRVVGVPDSAQLAEEVHRIYRGTRTAAVGIAALCDLASSHSNIILKICNIWY